MSSTTRILLGLLSGLVAGIAVSVAESPLLARLPAVIEPVGALWVNGIRMTVVPLIVSLLITAIVGSHGDGVLAKLGGKTLGLIAAMIAVVTLYTALLAPPLLAFLPVDAATAASVRAMTGADNVQLAELPPFRDWLVGLVPTNVLRAAADGAILPLLVFSILFGVAATRIGDSGRELILRFFGAIRDIMFVLIEWIMFVAPVGVFGLVFPLAAGIGLSAAGAIAYFLVMVAAMIMAALLLLYPIAALVGRLEFAAFARACAPAQAIGFSTRSSLAALPAQFDAAKSLGLSASVAGMVLPVCVSLFKFATPIGRAAGTFFIARLYGIELGPAETLLLAGAIGLLSFYSPGIPSGALLVMTPVYLMFGLPVQGIGILIALDLVVDMFITLSNVTANITLTALVTRSDR
ncbi:MAG: dicarboxylate/amino acid:cation symporter [Gammaproteobacteria bacterium]|nr:dicarboxylate/amino acid:cation symporter [Gammaproteobacteria bacterium]